MEITIDSQFEGVRLDKAIEQILKQEGFKQATRSMIKESISKGCTVNDDSVKPSHKLNTNEVLVVDLEYWKTFFNEKDLSKDIVAQEGELDILFEDEYLMVIFKPKDMVVHPGVGNTENTLANYIKYYLIQKDQLDINMDRVGIVHRLDKGVSGVMVVAKTKEVQDRLKEQFANREIDKLYLANVERFKESELKYEEGNNFSVEEIVTSLSKGELDFGNWFDANGYIGRSRTNRYKMEFKLYEFGGSKHAQSYILSVSEDKLLVKIITGRMHQIRATLQYYGYHIVGDNLYGSNSTKEVSNEIMLQSIYLSFVHPVTKKKLHFSKT